MGRFFYGPGVCGTGFSSADISLSTLSGKKFLHTEIPVRNTIVSSIPGCFQRLPRVSYRISHPQDRSHAYIPRINRNIKARRFRGTVQSTL